MKKVSVILLMFLLWGLSVIAQDKSMKLTLHLKGGLLQEGAVLFIGDSKESILLDENDEGSITVSLEKPVYAVLRAGYGKNQLYLEPGKDLDLTLIPNKDGSFPFAKNNFEYRGKNANINKYINERELQLMTNADFLLDEDAYLDKLAKLEKKNSKFIRKQKFPKDYEKNELLRMKYLLYEPLTRYPIQHFWKEGGKFSGLEQYEDTPKVKAFIPTLFVDSDELWEIDTYRDFLSSAVAFLSLKNGIMDNDKNKVIVDRLAYLTEHFKSPGILEDITHSSTIRYIEVTEGKPLGEIETYYNRYVKNEDYRKALADKQATWAKLGKGSEVQSHDVKYQDITGKMVALEDLKGKYVFIDVWATWCGPCCAELPHLKTLEEKFKDKNIYFVSISLDASKSAWVNKVQKDQLGGIQLHGGPKAQIMKDYKIHGIPRFILLDREGKVIDNNMTRPSDPKTTEVLEALEGI